MPGLRDGAPVITGIGVTSAIGQGQAAFTAALLEGQHAFGVMQRPGRQHGTSFLGAEIPSLTVPGSLSSRTMRTASFSTQVALLTVDEAWTDARLSGVDPRRIGLVVGGSNFQQRELVQAHASYADRLHFLRPTYGLSFMDTDVCGVCSEQFGIRGCAYTIGGASASGQLAILQAIQAIHSGQIDVCIAVGALMDLSYWECQGLRVLGAMGSDRFADDPARACRPFDRDRDGFIFGECCAAVVIERADAVRREGVTTYAAVPGWATVMDGHRNPDPSFDGEVQAITCALAHAGLGARDVDYVNPHGTGSVVGDETELKAIRACGLAHASINATKSLVGHGLSAAGVVEVVATLVQMKASRLHPTRNLDDPIDPDLKWVGSRPVSQPIAHALNLSLGFGGINTAICLRHAHARHRRAT